MSSILLTPEESAAELRIARSQVFVLLKTGVLPSVKIGRSRRIPREALVAYVRSLTEHAAGGGAA